MFRTYKGQLVVLTLFFSSVSALSGQGLDDSLPKISDQENISSLSFLPNLPAAGLPDSSFVLIPSQSSFLNQIKNVFKHLPSSEISVGYDYGLVPGYDYNLGSPIGTFVSNGNIGVPLLKTPCQLSYHYSDKRSSFGLNNYFRIGFDYQSFQKGLQDKKEQYAKKLTGQLDSLSSLKQDYLQKASYWQMIGNNLNQKLKMIPADSLIKDVKTNATQRIEDSLSNLWQKEKGQISIDSTLNKVNDYRTRYDSLNIKSETDQIPSREKINDSIAKIKSNQEKFIALYNQCSREIQNIQEAIDEIRSVSHNPDGFIKTLTPMEKAMQYTKKLDLGLCYPSNSMFLVNNVPLRGLSFEWSNDVYYISASAGVVENNILFSGNLPQNVLTNTHNLFNFFDFGNLNQGRKVVSIKGGVGKPDDTHFYVGWLSGWGLQSYAIIDSENVTSTALLSKEYNAVIEFDGNWRFAKTQAIEAIFSRSALKNSTEGDEAYKSVSSQLTGADNKNNALYVKYRGEIPKTKTSITAIGRYIEPNFQSFGTGFMLSNNVRYELRIDQHLFSSLRISGYVRQEHDNVLSLMQYTNTLRSVGISASGNVSRHLTISGSYSPVFQNIDSNGTAEIMKNRNDISNLNFIYNQRIRKNILTINGTYSVYRLSDTSNTPYLYNNSGLYLSLNGSKTSERLSVDYFNSNLVNGTPAITLLYGFNLTCKLSNKLSTIGELRCATSSTTQASLGGSLRIAYQCLKFCSINLEGERIVKGDFYSQFPSEIIDRFPYFISTRFIINL